MSPSQKMISLNDLEQRARSMQSEGLRLVLTNGCFDILHVGHVRYLQAAASLGDALAVAVNEDDSVRRLKGPNRPLTPATERAEVLAALECVRYVVLFPEETAVKVVEAVRPDVYVKGGDYSADPENERFPIEGSSVLSYGGHVAVVDLVPGRSTSDIIRRIERRA